LTPPSGRAFARALERNGWSLLRVTGSHLVYGKPGERARISVPVHGSQPMKRGLFLSLCKSAGLDPEGL
jgi:predicted RNA binding protein YcfA (HicA-like mRNA interferase family)